MGPNMRCVANLYIAQWEEDAIYANGPEQLIVYKRYIDIIVWTGTKESILDLSVSIMERILTLSWEIDEIHFLDLEICQEQGNVKTKTHFKTLVFFTF